ncbi:hypothetical protein MASR2M50_29910 [Thauera sp.]
MCGYGPVRAGSEVRGYGSAGRRGGWRRLHSRPAAALGERRRGGGDANSALRASDMRRLVSPAPAFASALMKLAPPAPLPGLAQGVVVRLPIIAD